MNILYKLSGPFIRKLSGNQAHDFGIWSLKSGLVPPYQQSFNPRLAMDFKGLKMAHPIGLAPGFDKNAVAVNQLVNLGFGHIEVGAVTPKAQDGNPKPTIFRSESTQAIINRMGFNNKGIEEFCKNISGYNHQIPLGVNIGKNKETEDAANDYMRLAAGLADKVDWITINVSSPNTPNLRNLQEIDSLRGIIDTVKNQIALIPSPPLLFVKIAPDLNAEDLVELAVLFKEEAIDAVVTTNTTISRPSGLEPEFAAEQGGLSGKPLFDLSLEVQKIMATELKGSNVAIVGSGGVYDVETAWQRIIYGASLLQLYTAMIWQGPYLAAEIAQGLTAKLDENDFDTITDAIGSAL